MAAPVTYYADLDDHVRRGLITPRPDGRFDVSDSETANLSWACGRNVFCILMKGHPGDCCEDRETVVHGPSWADNAFDGYGAMRESEHRLRPWWGVLDVALNGRQVTVYGPARETSDEALSAAHAYAAKWSKPGRTVAVRATAIHTPATVYKVPTRRGLGFGQVGS